MASLILTLRWIFEAGGFGGFHLQPRDSLQVEKPLNILAGARGQSKVQGRRRRYRDAEDAAVSEYAAKPAKAHAETPSSYSALIGLDGLVLCSDRPCWLDRMLWSPPVGLIDFSTLALVLNISLALGLLR